MGAISTTNNTLPVWKTFRFLYDDENNVVDGHVCCSVCQTPFTWSSSSGTSHLLRHQALCSAGQNSQPLVTRFCTSREVTLPQKSRNLLLESCVKYAAVNYTSFKSFNSNGFNQLINTAVRIGQQQPHLPFDASTCIPHRKTITSEVHRVAALERANFKQTLLDHNLDDVGAVLTADLWTSDVSTDHYLTIVIHFKTAKI